MIPLSPRQARCLKAIRDLTVDRVPPTLGQIAMALGNQATSKGGVHGILVELRDKGLVIWEPGRARTLRIVERPARADDLDLSQMSSPELRRLSERCLSILGGRAYCNDGVE